MKVYPINYSNYTYNGTTASKRVQNPLSANTRPMLNVNFRGGITTDKVNFEFSKALETLDHKTMLIVAADKERALTSLCDVINNINVKIFDYNLMKLEKSGDYKDMSAEETNFAIYKENDSYYVISLTGSPVYTLTVNSKGRDFDDKKDLVKFNSAPRRLMNGDEIRTGICSNKLIFNIPQEYTPANSNLESYNVSTSQVYYQQYKSEQYRANFNAINSIHVKNNFLGIQPQNETKKDIKFDDIGGLDEQINMLRKHVLRPIFYPDIYANIRLNKGILLYGPPRCGKTMLGKALATEAGIPFSYYNATEFKRPTYGTAESSVRELFEKAIKNKQIIFIDELDSIGRARSDSSMALYDNSLLNQLLGSLSDLEKSNTLSFVIAATNRKDMLDPALIGSGRLGMHIEIPLPDKEGIKQIFRKHTRGINLEENLPLDFLADKMSEYKFNGSDVAEIVSLAFFNMLERTGLDKKMDNRTISYDERKSIRLYAEDLFAAINSIGKHKIVR